MERATGVCCNDMVILFDDTNQAKVNIKHVSRDTNKNVYISIGRDL